MKIELAEKFGMCFGVKRALDAALAALQNAPRPVATLGPLAHNSLLVEALRSKGIEVVDDVKDAKATLLIRAHSVPMRVIVEAKERGLNVIDCTCPLVARVQWLASRLYREGYQVVVIGEKEHPEVVGIVDRAPGAIVVEGEEDVAQIPHGAKLGIVLQTTQDEERVPNLLAACLSRALEVKFFNTICAATRERQAALRQLAQRVDAIIVIGGRNSGNTRRLFEIARSFKPSWWIERVDELPLDELRRFERVGVTAGASTPDWVVKEVVEALGGRYPLETAIALLVRDGRMLLEWRGEARGLYPGTWCPPGGFKRENEEAIDILKRRMWEELRINVVAAEHVGDVVDGAGNDCIIHHLYLVRDWHGEPRPALGQRIEWIEFGKVRSLRVPEILRKEIDAILTILEAEEAKAKLSSN